MDREEKCMMITACIPHRILIGWLNQGGWCRRERQHAWGEVYRILDGRSEGGKPLGRPGPRRENNIKMDLTEMCIDGANWIQLARDRVRWRGFVKTVMNLWLP